jgi:hypothetical protein
VELSLTVLCRRKRKSLDFEERTCFKTTENKKRSKNHHHWKSLHADGMDKEKAKDGGIDTKQSVGGADFNSSSSTTTTAAAAAAALSLSDKTSALSTTVHEETTGTISDSASRSINDSHVDKGDSSLFGWLTSFFSS